MCREHNSCAIMSCVLAPKSRLSTAIASSSFVNIEHRVTKTGPRLVMPLVVLLLLGLIARGEQQDGERDENADEHHEYGEGLTSTDVRLTRKGRPQTLHDLSSCSRSARRAWAWAWCCLRHPLLFHREAVRAEEFRIHQVLLCQRAAQHRRRQEDEHQHHFRAKLEQVLAVRDLGLWGLFVYGKHTARATKRTTFCIQIKTCVIRLCV